MQLSLQKKINAVNLYLSGRVDLDKYQLDEGDEEMFLIFLLFLRLSIVFPVGLLCPCSGSCDLFCLEADEFQS